jgi:AcrR family transcriptional regulator
MSSEQEIRDMTGGYKLKLKARAERAEQTRQRIVLAAFRLHSTVGPARTTISAIAEHAGVQRMTVYQHFPDERQLYAACTGHSLDTDPPPDPAAWRRISDPQARLRHALAELYPYYRRNEALIANVLHDAAFVVERLQGDLPDELAEFFAMPARWRDALRVGHGLRGRQRRLLLAALGLAVDFQAWHTLTRGGSLSDAEAVEAMAGLVEGVTAPTPAT